MLVRVPDYFDRFHCLVGACPHSCCEKWEVMIDEGSAMLYRGIEGALGEKLRSALQQDEEGDLCFLLKGGRCPFLDEENLCEIHRELGEEATSITCREHPRFTEDYGSFREITLSASCPAANHLLLENQKPLYFLERRTEEKEEKGDPWLEDLLPIRDGMLDLLRNREYPLKVRLGRLLQWAEAVQPYLDEDCLKRLEEIALPEKLTFWAILPKESLQLLQKLEKLEEDWSVLLTAAERKSVEICDDALERIAVYFAFRYLLKCINDGDLLSRAQLVVFSVLTVEKLAAECGLSEALRRFSCEVEHSQNNLYTLLNAFQWETSFALERFMENWQR